MFTYILNINFLYNKINIFLKILGSSLIYKDYNYDLKRFYLKVINNCSFYYFFLFHRYSRKQFKINTNNFFNVFMLLEIS